MTQDQLDKLIQVMDHLQKCKDGTVTIDDCCQIFEQVNADSSIKDLKLIYITGELCIKLTGGHNTREGQQFLQLAVLGLAVIDLYRKSQEKLKTADEQTITE